MFFKISKAFKVLVSPTSQNEDVARRESILNVLLVSVIFLSATAFFINFLEWFIGLGNPVSAGIIFLILSLFVFLYFLSHKGFVRLASYGLLVIFSLPVIYQSYSWGIDLPSALLLYSLIIVMAGMLINTRFALFVTAIIVAIISLIGYAEYSGFLKVDRYWREQAWVLGDIVLTFSIFFIIAVISWLSNREIEKSLARARKSEEELKAEKDSLEIKVEERTRELKETQAEKMAQLYRFSEFGRLSSGLFHDLINPLTAVSLSIEKVKSVNQEARTYINSADLYKNIVRDKTAGPRNLGAAPIAEVSEHVERAVLAARKMEDMVNAVRRQLSRQESKTLFSLNKEIEYVIEVLAYRARKANVGLHFLTSQSVEITGDAVKFNQIVLNLVANAVDAGGKIVQVFLVNKDDSITLSVQDDGVGIPEENISRIFEPFFSTKPDDQGMGIGLSMTKRIVEKDFGGTIKVASKEGEGSVFTVVLPIKINE